MESRAPVSRSARLSLWLADAVAVVAVLSAAARVVAAVGPGSEGPDDAAMIALTVCALAGVVLGGAFAIRTRAPGAHWSALLTVAGPVLVAAIHPVLAGIPAVGVALLFRRAVHTTGRAAVTNEERA